MKRYLIITLMLITGISAVRSYTLEDMIDAGLNNSYGIRQKQIMLKNADLSVTSAAWNLLPDADANFRRTNTDENYYNNGSFTVSRSLTLNEPTVFNYKQARLDKTIAKLDWQQTRKEIVYGILSSWLDIAQLQKEISIRTVNLAVLTRIKEQSTLQQRLGQRTSFDVNQSDINVINAQLTINDLKNQLAAKRADLFNQVKLRDDGSELEIVEDSLAVFSLDFSNDSDEPILLKKLKQDMHKTQMDKLQQKIGLLPTLSVSGSYSQYSITQDVLDFDNYDDSYTLSLNMSWSLWSPFTKGSNYAQIRNSLTLKQWQYEDNQASLLLDKANLKREWTYLSETLDLNKRKANQAQINLRYAQEKYNLGTLSLIELEQARVDALDAELAVNKISYQLQKKIQEWNLLNSFPILNKY